MQSYKEDKDRVIIAAGGTGGHIFPALAVIEELRAKMSGVEFTWIGSSHRMESEIIPRLGIEFIGLRTTEIRRKITPGNIFYNVRSLWYLLTSFFKVVGILRSIKPRFVLATGGFAAGAAGLAAWITRTPLVLMEPNAYPGITNRFLGNKAPICFVAHDDAKKYFPESRTIKAGYPARKGFLSVSREQARHELGISDSTIYIVATGGSQGANSINTNLPLAFEIIVNNTPAIDVRVLHQAGRGKTGKVKSVRDGKLPSYYTVVEFIDNMPVQLAAADVIISRGGAASLSEIAIMGVPAVLIPYPQSSENHQVKNARSWEREGAAVCIEEKDLNPAALASNLEKIIFNPEMRANMKERVLKFADPQAASFIADQLKRFF